MGQVASSSPVRGESANSRGVRRHADSAPGATRYGDADARAVDPAGGANASTPSPPVLALILSLAAALALSVAQLPTILPTYQDNFYRLVDDFRSGLASLAFVQHDEVTRRR